MQTLLSWNLFSACGDPHVETEEWRPDAVDVSHGPNHATANVPTACIDEASGERASTRRASGDSTPGPTEGHPENERPPDSPLVSGLPNQGEPNQGKPQQATPGGNDHLLKLLLLGDSDVGKSQLVMQFCEGKSETDFVLTIGLDFKWKTLQRNGKQLKLQIWDTAGQERFRTITPAFYRAAMGVALVYDITNRSSFLHVTDWLSQLDRHRSASVQRILIGNNSHRTDQRQVTREEGATLASKFNMGFFEVSAQNGDGVEDAFLSLVDLVAGSPLHAPLSTTSRHSSPRPVNKLSTAWAQVRQNWTARQSVSLRGG